MWERITIASAQKVQSPSKTPSPTPTFPSHQRPLPHPSILVKMKTPIAALGLGFGALTAAQAPTDSPDCKPMPIGNAPIQNTTSVKAFDFDPVYTELAMNATVPFGYDPIFLDMPGSYQNERDYIRYVTLDEYSTDQCGAVCASLAGCQSFNIYVLRVPTVVCLFEVLFPVILFLRIARLRGTSVSLIPSPLL
jgi:hypothetical protein